MLAKDIFLPTLPKTPPFFAEVDSSWYRFRPPPVVGVSEGRVTRRLLTLNCIDLEASHQGHQPRLPQLPMKMSPYEENPEFQSHLGWYWKNQESYDVSMISLAGQWNENCARSYMMWIPKTIFCTFRDYDVPARMLCFFGSWLKIRSFQSFWRWKHRFDPPWSWTTQVSWGIG